MSKAALWMTSRASPRKATNSAATARKVGLSARKAVVRPCTCDGVGRNLALGVDVAVEDPAGGHVVEELDRAELDDAVAGVGVEAGGLGVEHDLTHRPALPLSVARSARTSRRAASMPRSVPMTKSARARFSASGICRARMRSSASGVMPGRASTRARCTASGAVTTRTPSRPRSPPVSKRSGMSKTTIVRAGVRRGEGLAVGGDERVDARLDAREEARGRR